MLEIRTRPSAPASKIEVIDLLDDCNNLVESMINTELEKENTAIVSNYLPIANHLSALARAVSNKEYSSKTASTYPSAKLLTEQNDTVKNAFHHIINTTLQQPKVTGLDDIIGLWNVKQCLRSLIILPQTQPQLFEGRQLYCCILLYGPPGTGKTRLVHALAAEANCNLHVLTAADFLSSFVGQTEKAIQALFNYLRSSDKCNILFIDEIDSFCRSRNDKEHEYTRRLKTEFMCQLSNLEESRHLTVICATNCPWDLDAAILRRFQRRLHIPLPDLYERFNFFDYYTKCFDIGEGDQRTEFLQKMANLSDKCSFAELDSVINCAHNNTLIELEENICWNLTSDGYFIPANVSITDPHNVIIKKLSDLPPGSVKGRKVNNDDLEAAIVEVRPVITDVINARYHQFN